MKRVDSTTCAGRQPCRARPAANRHRRATALFTWAALAGACDRSSPTAPPVDGAPAVDVQPTANALGRAGPVTLDLAGLRAAIDEARILQIWQRGAPPSLSALVNPLLRRRLLTQAMERRVIRAEAARRGLAASPGAYLAMLARAAAGRPPEAPVPTEIPDDTTLDAQLAARYGAPPARVRQVVADTFTTRLLIEALLDETDDDTLRTGWLDDETRVSVDLVEIPRVPTFREIDRAVASRPEALKKTYEANRRLFHTPERAVIRRILIAVPEGAGPVKRDAARAQIAALRDQILAGADFEALAREHGKGRKVRQGGLLRVTERRLPQAFSLKVGEVSAPLPHPRGWMLIRVERRLPGMHRSLTEPTVKREVAATLLRETDDLPHARSVAEQVRQLLRQAPRGRALSDLIERERLRRKTTPPFGRGGARIVPGVGLAPALFDAIFRLSDPNPVTAVVRIRQDYIVARRGSHTAPDPSAWPEARAAFVERWREHERPVVLDGWLSRKLAGEPMWIDQERLAALSMEDLGAGPDAGATAPP